MTTPQQRAIPDLAPGAADNGPEEALMRYVIRLGAERRGRVAIQFHLSRITRAHRNRKHLSIAANMLRELLEPMLHDPFILRDGDVVVLRERAEPERLAEAVEMLRYLLSAEAPLAQSAEPPYSFFELEREYLPLLASLLRISESEDRRGAVRRPAAPAVRSVLPPADLGAIMQRLGKLELANYLRQQTVWSLSAAEAPRAVFDELYVAVKDLGEALTLAPEVVQDPQVFGLVTRTFDKYILSTLLKDRSAARRPVSINLNLHSLLSADFLRFEAQRQSQWRGQIVLEIPFAGIWSDLPAFFAFARRAREDGFSCCIDGVTHHALPLVDLHRLDADFVKVIWDDSMLQLDETGLREMCRALRDCGTERVILARCGRHEALQFGQAANIRMFQGWFIDGLARELSRAAPIAAA
jgi:EAL domain-containing protein (putative c-di-GMP-specific phosphodiesterase class I)